MSDQPQESPRERLFRRHEAMCTTARKLMKKKNSDYSTEKDPYLNFRRHGAKGFVVRLDDKMCRLNTFVDRGFLEVESESVADALLDTINYSVLLYSYLVEEGLVKENE